MSDSMRWRYGDTNPVVLAVDSGTVIEIGDLVYLDTDDAKPASAQADQLSEAANQLLFASKFAGVAMQRSPGGNTNPIRVATTGVFEFSIAATTFEVGDLIGSKEAANGTQLENQVVTKVSATNKSLGRCVKRSATNVTGVLVDIVSTVVKGGTMPPT
jgi:Uncharacterized conserved protein (DUF2190)